MKKLIVLVLITIFAFSCTTRKVDKVEEKIVYVDKVKKDSIFINKEIIKTDTIFNEILVDCDSTSFSQKFGDSSSNIKIVKEKGKVLIKYVKSPTETKYEKIYVEKEIKKDSISTEKKVENTTKTKSNFFSNIYKIAFFVLLVLWILGITPKFIISRFI
mgnify:FL=1